MDTKRRVKRGEVPRYDIVVSFAGEDRPFVRGLVERLKRLGISVFYDHDEQSRLWGSHDNEFLVDLILHRCRFCVMIISKRYAEKEWPRLERRAAFDRAMKQEDAFVLPIRLDDSELPGLLSTVGYQDARKSSADDLAALLLEMVQEQRAREADSEPHPGSHPPESPIAARLFDEVIATWPSPRAGSPDRFLKYDSDFLISAYPRERPIAPGIPYVEVANWVSTLNEGRLPRPEVLSQAGQFHFADETPEMAELREAGFIARRGRNVGTSNETVISVQGYDAINSRLLIQPATYHDQVRSNLIMDYQENDRGPSLRSLICRVCGGALSEFGSGYLADTLGAAVLIFFHHGSRLFPYLVPRSRSMPVFPGGWHVSASGAMKWPSEKAALDGPRGFERCVIDDMYDEIREEIGLFRSPAEKQRSVRSNSVYREFESLMGDLDGADISELRLIAFCRELLRGGKPQLFFIAYTPLDWAELTKRRVMATKVTRKVGAREEIDERLLHMMPPQDATFDAQYRNWSNLIRNSGYTHELVAMLHYASQLSLAQTADI